MTTAPRRTGGGLFDPDDRGHFFLAAQVTGGPNCATVIDPQHRHILVATDTLTNPTRLALLEQLIAEGRKVLLDSGVFAFANDHARKTGISPAKAWATPPDQMPGFDKLWDRFINLARTYGDNLWGYIEIDLGGVDSKRRLRTRLEDLGLAPIPVYHPLYDGWDYFDELATTYDRVAWANLTGANLRRNTRVRLLQTAWERHRRHPDLWLHLLGLSPNEWAPGYLAGDSSDSSSWNHGLRYGPGAMRGTTHLRSLGALPADFDYLRVSKGGGSSDTNDTNAMSKFLAVDYHFLELNWRRIRDDHTHLFDLPPVPPISEELP